MTDTLDFRTIDPDKSLALFVKNILVFEERENTGKTLLPFYADGYPGLIYHKTGNGLFVRPQNKTMPQFFIYGQTIHPIELHMQGTFQMIVFQLYPFVLKSFFDLSPQDLNDECFDLQQLENTRDTLDRLQNNPGPGMAVDRIAEYLLKVFDVKKSLLDRNIEQALRMMIKENGQLPLESLYERFPITPRTFQRRFKKEVGISARQFCQIIRFQESFQQVAHKDYHRLTDVVYSHGFADQSHFTRVFKAFTGVAPKDFEVPRP